MAAGSATPFERAGPLEAREFKEIQRLAYRTFGLDLHSGKEELVNSRLRRLVVSGGFPSFRDYCRSVLSDRSGAALADMIDALTTNHTAFLRERDHFDFLAARAGELFEQRRTVEIWSAGCATGEEVWSLACVLDAAGAGTRVHIWGTDISNRALRAAAEAVYPADRCRSLPAPWLSRYFEPDFRKEHYRVAAAVRSRVSFQRLNLAENFSWPRRFPVIFCRNVMIYFDQSVQQRVVGRVEQALEPGGYLFIGHAETLMRVSHSLEYVQPAIYRKRQTKGWPWTRS